MTTRQIIDYAAQDSAKEMRDELYSNIHDRVMQHIDAKKVEIAQTLIAPEQESTEEESVENS